MVLKDRLHSVFSDVSDALVENEDGMAANRQSTFFLRMISNFFSILITGNYYTGLLLAIVGCCLKDS